MKTETGVWDVVVVGTGPGGATLGLALAKAGRRVLFLEKGTTGPRDGNVRLDGDYAEQFFSRRDPSESARRGILRRAGRYDEPILDRSRWRSHAFVPFIGEGAGGSSALYGMAMERLFPEDFVPAGHHPEVSGALVPSRWPITYDELRPYYRRAELLFGVHGEVDPLRGSEVLDPLAPPPRLSEASRELADHLRAQGAHPYRLPMACDFVPGCRECQGFLCDRECKRDAWRVCLEPAIREHGADLWNDCTVVSLRADRRRVTGVVCRRGEREFVVRADLVVLAAGALATPALLLRSSCDAWPKGLANDSGLVGRCLMRHCIDMYAVRTDSPAPAVGHGLTKEIAFSDLYLTDGEKLGSVQSFGRLPPADVVLEELRQAAVSASLRGAGALLSLASPIVRFVVEGVLGRRVVLASIVEDLPYPGNHVRPVGGDSAEIAIRYRCQGYERRRIRAMRRRLRTLLSPYRTQLIKQAENNERIAHACGTCRFGDDPKDSVLDRNNRAHGLDNLYVVDASFLPTSGGINPALTLIANALRVADVILGRQPAS